MIESINQVSRCFACKGDQFQLTYWTKYCAYPSDGGKGHCASGCRYWPSSPTVPHHTAAGLLIWPTVTAGACTAFCQNTVHRPAPVQKDPRPVRSGPVLDRHGPKPRTGPVWTLLESSTSVTLSSCSIIDCHVQVNEVDRVDRVCQVSQVVLWLIIVKIDRVDRREMPKSIVIGDSINYGVYFQWTVCRDVNETLKTETRLRAFSQRRDRDVFRDLAHAHKTRAQLQALSTSQSLSDWSVCSFRPIIATTGTSWLIINTSHSHMTWQDHVNTTTNAYW